MPGFRTGRPDIAIPGHNTGGLSWGDLTFARAGAKYRERVDGTLVLVPSGAPSFSPRGLLIEPAITNLATHSIGLADWTPTGTNAPTATPDFAAGPDGNTTATKLVVGACTNAQESKFSLPFTAAASKYTFHLWAKAIDAGAQFCVGILDPDGVTVYSTKVTPSADGQRYSFAAPTALTSGTAYLLLGWLLGQGDHAQAASLVADFQVEAGEVAHSYVPNATASPVTCPKDVAYFSGISIPAAATISLRVTPRTAMADGNYHLLFDTRSRVSAFDGCYAYVDPSGTLVASFQDAGGPTNFFTASPLSWTALQTYAIELSSDGLGNASLTRDGVVVATGTSQKVVTATYFTIGAAGASGDTLPWDGWLGNPRIES